MGIDPPTVNIIITQKCPNKCPYCFNQSVRRSEEMEIFQRHISLENFSIVLEFIKRSGIKDARLLGGEPLIHPQIPLLLELLRGYPEIKTVTIFTGGFFPQHVISLLDSANTRIVLNLNHPSIYRKDQHTIILKNLTCMVEEGLPVTLGYNIYENPFDFQFLIDTAIKFDIKCIRLCIANPNINAQVNVLGWEARRGIGKRLVSMVEKCSESGFELVFDCVMPSCYFTDEEWGRVAKRYPQSIGGCGVCSPALDIDPELKVHRCFAFEHLDEIELSKFKDSNELSDYFAERIDKFKWLTTLADCRSCYLFKSRKCQGDCIAFRHAEIKELKALEIESKAFFEIAYEKLRSCDNTGALSSFQNGLAVYPYNVKAISDYIFALLRNRDIDKALAALEKYEPTLERITYGPYHLIRGIIAEWQDEQLKALSHYRRALLMIDDKHRDYIKNRLAALRTKIDGRQESRKKIVER